MDIRSSPRRWWVLAALSLALVTIGLDTTILNVALPTLSRELDASIGELQWFSNAYTLALAAALLPAGLLGDRFGPKWLLVGGMALFGAASAGCALSGGPAMLIAARAVLGIGAAFMIPLSSAVLTTVFSPQERSKAIAVWATSMSVGIPLGPILGGVLLQHFSWGSVFWVNVPLAVIGVVAMGILVPATRGHRSGRTDLPGVVLSVVGLAAFTYGLVRAGTDGWLDAQKLIEIVAGLVVLVAFGLWQRRAAEPLVDLGLFRSAGFTWGSLLATFASFGLMGVMFVLPQFFSSVEGADALGSGLRLLPLIGGLLAGVRVSDRVRPRSGATVVVSTGFALMTLGIVLGAFTSAESTFAYVAAWSAVAGLGLGFALPASMDLALGALEPGRAAAGSALTQSLRQVGATLGVAILGSVLNTGFHNRLGTTSPERAFAHGMDVMLVVTAVVTAVVMALAALLAARFLPAHADDVAKRLTTDGAGAGDPLADTATMGA